LSPNPLSLLSRYHALASARLIERDPAQLGALETLERLAKELTPAKSLRAALGALLPFGRKSSARSPRGVYLWGHVGRGKTTLMDLFFNTVAVDKKRRVHFHAFMNEVHDRLHRARREGAGQTDPVSRVAEELSRETRLLCFDEFSVSDIADASILARLFSTLFANGVVVVATSNVEPNRLYEGGRNRDLFLPFIKLLQQRMEVVHLDARADFRLERQCFGEVFFNVSDPGAREAAQAQMASHMGDQPCAPTAVAVKGRKIEVPLAHDRTARFAFNEICGRPLGAADYLALTRSFDKIIVDDVPVMNFDRRNEAKRFITLVDVLYEAKTKLILSAQAEPAGLYQADQGAEALEFARTVSRLAEMRSQQYLEEWAERCSQRLL